MAPVESSATHILMFLLALALGPAPVQSSTGSDMPALRASRWVNSSALTPSSLRGKVVLVDFWEYTCINWIRTSPYVKAWHRDYAKYGLVVVGIHSPEFEFGKLPQNVVRGIREHELTYPIAIDNDFTIWRAFHNDAWPAKYLFDGEGTLVRHWVGEGNYAEVESEIRRLLLMANSGVALPPVSDEARAFAAAAAPSYNGITPEMYLGNERREQGTFTLEGGWQRHRQFVELQSGIGKLILPFTAGSVNLVAEPGKSGKSAIAVLLDGRPIVEGRGADVGPDGVARFEQSGMLRLVTGAPRQGHVLTLVTTDPGTRIYVLTFGP